MVPFHFIMAQKTVYHNDIETTFRNAQELYDKAQYGAAKKKFLTVYTSIENPHSEMAAIALYHASVSAVRLYNNDAEMLLNDFISTYPEHAFINMAYFYQGVFQYSKRSYGRALRAFENVDSRHLESADLAEFHFKMGYSHFMRENYEAAAKSFHIIKDVVNDYQAPANYYYAHIAYLNNRWETAHRSFMGLREDPIFGSLVPFYIVQIYFMQERFSELLDEAPPLLAEAEEEKVPEIARMIGEAHFQQNNFAEALHYLNIYTEGSRHMLSREDKYQLGFANYQAGNYHEAIEFLTQITGESDSLSQNANYLLADCYLRTDQKNYALNAFKAVLRENYDKRLHQSALLNFAKLSYELSFNPYNDAVIALMDYIDTYPDSDDIDEANRLLVNVFFDTKNYRAALESIEKITFKTTELKSAYQQIAYLRGLELFNNRDFRNAIEHFDKSFTYRLDPQITASAKYWKAESYYRLNRFEDAAAYFNKFLVSPGAFQLPFYNLAHYNKGYALFKQEKFNESITAFRKFLSAAREEDDQIVHDAYIRVGDAYYVTKRYSQAIDFYSRAVRANAAEADYAMFQKAICYGVLTQFDAKISTLENLLRIFSQSSYTVDAKYELGNTFLAIGDNTSALRYFNKIVQDHATSSYKVHALLKIGLIHFNLDNNEQALSSLKRVVEEYPGTESSKDALVSIRDIYVNTNRPDDFFLYVKNIPFANVSVAEQDSITYMAVQNQYMSGDCTNALKGFSDYIEKFEDGIFVIDAHFYKAECLFRKGRKEQALQSYNYVLSRHRTKFTESALVRASEINFQNKNYEAALENFKTLEKLAERRSNIINAQAGQMRTYYNLKAYQNAIDAAQRLITQERIDEVLLQEARLIMGKSYLSLQKTSHAQAEFLGVARMSENEMKAEAMYMLALIQYELGNYKASEEIVFEMINTMPSYDYWIAKGFILLADNLVAMGNTFQARHTLESIINNYEGLDLVQIAFEKLNQIKKIEKRQGEKKQENDVFEIED